MEMNHSGYVMTDEDISTAFKCNVGSSKMLKNAENVQILRKWMRPSVTLAWLKMTK